jgi:exonuclease 3'-5' domain-containing protein 1
MNTTSINLLNMTSLEMITTRELGKLELSEPEEKSIWKPTPAVMVDTSATLKSLVDTLMSLERSSGSVYVDLEGVKLSRLGSISLIQILVPLSEQAFIVDVHTLGKTAFDTLGSEGKSLKNALESDNLNKYLFDVRNDSDALFALFGVRLAGAVDIQLLELASREGEKHVLCGLAKCIEQEQALPPRALEQWQRTKKEVVKMFDPKFGGTYEVFNVRPLPQDLVEYCVGDVEFLPLLSKIYQSRLGCHWLEKVRVETGKRLEESRSPKYKPHGRQKALGPNRWRFPPEEGKKSESTATVEASASKKAHKSSVTVGTPALKEKRPTANMSASVPKKGKKSTATVAGAAPKTGEKSSAGVGGSESKKREKPSAVPTPNKGGKSTATAAAPASANGKKPIAAIAAPASKKEKKSTAMIVVSATSGEPAPLANQMVLTQPIVSKASIFD